MEKGLDIRTILKAKLLRLRQLVMGKKTKQDIKRLTPQELRNLTPAQMMTLEMTLKKDANKKDGEWSEYCECGNHYNDCHGDYYDAE